MDWVDGKTLGLWFRDAVERQDSAAIKQMALEWIKLVCELRSHGISHCDLQHGNVMVMDEKLVLVDYDGMFVPTMDTGNDNDRVAWEAGEPNYQHPGRPQQLLSSAIDDFSAWLILISLRAVADDLSLWHRHIGATNAETLLFTERDIKQPAASQLWPELASARATGWSASGRPRCGSRSMRPFEEIPPFTVDIFGPLREVIKAGDWRQILALATSHRYASANFPPDIATTVNEANKRVERAQRFEQRIAAGKLRDIAKEYRPELLDDWLDPALIAQGQAARAAVELLDEVAREREIRSERPRS